MKILILIYLFFNALAYIKGVEMRQAQEFFFQISSVLLILSSLLFTPKGKPAKQEWKFNAALFALFAWSLCVYLFYKEGWPTLFNLFLGVGVYLTAIRNLVYDDLKFIIKGIGYIAGFVTGYLILQYLGFDMRDQTTRGAYQTIPKCSIFGLQAHYGLYLAMIIPLFFYKINDIDINGSIRGVIRAVLVFLGVGVAFIALYPSNSTAAYLGLLAAVLFFFWHKKRVIFWAFLAPVILGTIFYIVKFDNPMGMQGTRIDMWCKVIQDGHSKPFGHGLDSFRTDEKEGAVRYFKYAYNNKTVRVKKMGQDWMMQESADTAFLNRIKEGNPLDLWDDPHNEYIKLFYWCGFPALIALGFMLYYLMGVFRFSARRPIAVASFASLISIAIFSTMQFPFGVARIGHMIPIIAGMFIVSARDEN